MKTHHRDIIAFLRTHGAENPRLQHHGRHPRIAYRWHGTERTYVVPGTPGDTRRGTQNAIADLRRELGPRLPTPDKPKRTIEDLMPQPFNNPRVLPAETLPPPVILQGTIANYKAGVRVTFPKHKSVGNFSRAVCQYKGNLNWEITLSNEKGVKLRHPHNSKDAYEIHLGNIKDQPIFGATFAEFLISDDKILAHVKGEPRPVAKPKGPGQLVSKQQQAVAILNNGMQWFEQRWLRPQDVQHDAALAERFLAARAAAKDKPAPPKGAPPADMEHRLRNALDEIRALEAQTVYRLVKVKRTDGEHWAWSAPRIE